MTRKKDEEFVATDETQIFTDKEGEGANKGNGEKRSFGRVSSQAELGN